MSGRLEGPACATCRRACRKCDRARPACKRCISKGLDCGGYPEKFRFIGLASRGKWKNATFSNAITPAALSSVVSGSASRNTESASEDAESLRPALRPSPVSIDLIACPDSRRKTLLRYYDEVICPHQIAMIPDSNANPYRKYILPLAYEHPAILYAVLGLAACHQGIQDRDDGMRYTEAVHYQSAAIRALLELLRKEEGGTMTPTEYDAVLATIQIMVLHDICDTGVSTNGVHVTGSGGISARLMAGGKVNQSHSRTVFFVANLAWLDLLRAFAGPERMCFSWELLQTLAKESDNLFEMVNGIPRDMFLIIGEAFWHAKRHLLGELPDMDFRGNLNKTLDRLREWKLGIETHYPIDDQPWHIVAEAFRHACILRVLRLLDPSRPANDAEIQSHVTKALDATAQIPKTCPLIELLIMPLFIAGADAIARHSRRYVLTLFDEIKGRSGFQNPAPKEILLKVWDARDRQPDDDLTNILWTKFTRSDGLERQHDYYII